MNRRNLLKLLPSIASGAVLPAISEPKSVPGLYIASIETECGVDLYADTTHEGLLDQIDKYVIESWNDWMEGFPIPATRAERFTEFLDWNRKDHGRIVLMAPIYTDHGFFCLCCPQGSHRHELSIVR